MFIIRNATDMARALCSPIDSDLKALLRRRLHQLYADTGGGCDLGDLAHFVLVDPGDGAVGVEIAAGFPLFHDPAFEWVQDHGTYLEGVVILSDDGFGIALFVPNDEAVDPLILSTMRDQARGERSSER